MSVDTPSVTVAPTAARFPRGTTLLVGAWLAGVVSPLVWLYGLVLFTDIPTGGDQGLYSSLAGVALFGHAATLIAFAITLGLGRDRRRAPVVAVVLAVLSVLSLVIFWSGAPVVLGAGAAWCAGLPKDREPLPGRARIAGRVGVGVAVLNLVIWYGSSLAAVLTR